MSKKGRVLTSILTVVVLLAGTAFLLLRNSSFLQATTGKELSNIKVEGNKVTVDLVAKETETELAPGVKMPVWTYNGTVPGQEIRVKQGQDITVNLKNELSVPATIHWHGYPVPNDQDGVPGLTQETVKPGQTFTYHFNAKMAGTYWYHSHEDSANQVGKGLAGTLIVEKNDEQQKPDKDLTVMLQEWVKPMAGMDHSNMSGMDHSQMMTQDTSTMDHMAMYNLFTVNGKSGSLIDPLKVKTGDKIRVRFINAGFQTRLMDFGNVSYKVVSTDGQDI
ncbi:MAG TPA: copper oxidase, partial [Paenibacillaceae bacterium]|nr:copper oxidase [Paenibacillaceae bacterium]